ncbi:MAG: hypothetical protein AAGE52_40530 [Myxococcota bacterium]
MTRIAVAFLILTGCGDNSSAPDAGGEDASRMDSAAEDTGASDTGGARDGASDTGAVDAALDAALDAGTSEAPARIDVSLAGELRSGELGPEWSAEASRGYVTQARLPWLNGGFGSTSATCGLEGAIVRVTNLDDSGPGSLRDAIEEVEGPRTVVFEVSGAIRLLSEIDVEEPFITIAGQTAPPPGISLYNAGLIVRTHDVCVQHLRIRVGDRRGDGSRYTSSEGDDLDALSIRNNRGLPRLDNVVFDNLSLSWSSDEMFSLDRENISDVTLRDILIAEPLNDNLHPRGVHGYCALVSSRAGLERVSLIGNVMAHCIRRGPRIDEGTVVAVNNFTYNPGVYAIQLFGNDPSEDLFVSLVGNWMAYPDDSALRWPGTVDGNRGTVKALVQNYYEGEPRDVRVHLRENRSAMGLPIHLNESAFETSETPSELIDEAEVWHGSIYAIAPSEAEAIVLENVGAFPRFRDATDERVIADIRARRGTYIDSQEDVGGYPALDENRRELSPPEEPQADDDGDGISNLVEWLQGFVDAIE